MLTRQNLELARGVEPRFHPYQRCVLSKLDDASDVELVVTRKLNHRVTNAALFLLSYTSGNGAGDRTRTGVWTLARSHLSHWNTPAAWSGVRESNSSGWFGRPVPKALGQPRLKPSY